MRYIVLAVLLLAMASSAMAGFQTGPGTAGGATSTTILSNLSLSPGIPYFFEIDGLDTAGLNHVFGCVRLHVSQAGSYAYSGTPFGLINLGVQVRTWPDPGEPQNGVSGGALLPQSVEWYHDPFCYWAGHVGDPQFNADAVIGPYDLKFELEQNVDGTWHLAPYVRIPAASARLYYWGYDLNYGPPDTWFPYTAWDSGIAFDITSGQLVLDVGDGFNSGAVSYSNIRMGAYNELSLVPTPDSLYIKPGEQILVNMDVSSLTQKVNACQAMLGYSSTYFASPTSGSVQQAGSGPWDFVIWDSWVDGTGIPGEIDTAIGVDAQGSVGTDVDATVCKVVLTSNTGVEGSTRIEFRPDVPGNDTKQTFLSDVSGQAVWPAKSNSQLIVIDGTAPVITCPADQSVSNDAGLCSAVVSVGTATATDPLLPDGSAGSGVDTVAGVRDDSQALNAPYPVGTTTITWTGTDRAGNFSACQQTITVSDTELPVITCPADQSVNNDAGLCSAVVSVGLATATDNCGVPSVVGTRSDSKPLTDPYPVGVTTITWVATDIHGNTQSCVQTITVTDDEDPSITCPADLSVNSDPGVCTWTPAKLDEAFEVDPDLNVWVVDRYAPVAFNSVAFDGGNRLHIGISASDWQTNVFRNTQGRQRAFTPNPCVSKISGELYIPASWATSKRRSDIWGTTRDAWNNISGYPIIGFANVDGASPVLRVYSQDTDEDPSNGYQAGWRDLPNSITYDRWYRFDIEIAGNQFKFYVDGTLAMTDSGTFGSLSFSAMILQGYNFQEDYDIYWDNVQAGPLMAVPTVDDNCDISGITYLRSDGLALGDPYPRGSTTITWTVTDVHGNSSFCAQTVTVTDAEKPVVTSATAAPACVKDQDVTITATGTDNCTDPASLLWEHKVGAGLWTGGLTVLATELSEGVNTLYARAKDESGNYSDEFTVANTVSKDTTVPVISAVTASQGGSSVLCPGGVAIQGVVDIYVTASDGSGCAGMSEPAVTVDGIGAATYVDGTAPYHYTVAVLPTTANGSHTISVTATDGLGNSSSSSASSICVNKNQITGSVQLEAYVGASRAVTFVATGGTETRTWTFTATGHITPFTLTNVPSGTTHISAKTNWSLRKKIAVSGGTDGQWTADFTGTEPSQLQPVGTGNYLRGGDIDNSNSVTVLDYSRLKTKWGLNYDALADIDGDGAVGTVDYSIMKANWFKTGDQP